MALVLVAEPRAQIYSLKNAVAVTVPVNIGQEAENRLAATITKITRYTCKFTNDQAGQRRFAVAYMSMFHPLGRKHFWSTLKRAPFWWQHEVGLMTPLAPPGGVVQVFENKGADSLLKAIGINLTGT